MARGKEQRPAEILIERIRALQAPRTVVLVDGPAASGKTTLADEIAYGLKAELISMDQFYPGWDGLEAGSAMVAGSLLHPESPGWRRWDWKAGKAAEWHKLNPKKNLVIEGSGALSALNRQLASYAIWIHLPLAERLERKKRRDGTLNMQHWDAWAEQERAFYLRERPDQLADVVFDSAANTLSD